MGYEFMRLADVPESAAAADNANVLIEQDGEIARVPKAKIGAQADWSETDETSPAFILNKPQGVGGGGVDNYYFVSNGTYTGFVHGTDTTGEQVSLYALKNSFDAGNMVLLKGYNIWTSALMLGYRLSDYPPISIRYAGETGIIRIDEG